MEIVYYMAAGLAAAGVLLVVFFSLRHKRQPEFLDEEAGSGKKVLYGFAVVALLFAAFAVFTYWRQLFANRDDVFYFGGLILCMVFGMFVQVLYSAYREHKKIEVSATQLVLPLLFSIVVFYPIWAMATTSARGFFVFHAAFLNGYFWESLVTAAKPPKPPEV